MISPSARQWWRRAAAAVKDKRTLYATRLGLGFRRNPEIEYAVIRATTHDERSLDYKAAARVFAYARAAPSSFLDPLLRSLSRRACHTRSWPVALKSLLISHGLLLLSPPSTPSRLPFDLSDFRDPTHPSFSSFVRSYFLFLDHRSILIHHHRHDTCDHGLAELKRIERLQTLLDLLMQVRPCSDDMGVGLILEALDCILIEIFEIYSGICNGIAGFLVGFLNSAEMLKRGEDEARRGLLGIRILRRAGEQSSQLSGYFEVCRQLGVLNAAELPAVDSIPEEDVNDLERFVLGGIMGNNEASKEDGGHREKVGGGDREEGHSENSSSTAQATVVTQDWVVFEDEGHYGNVRNQGYSGNPFLDGYNGPWASMFNLGPNSVTPVGMRNGDLIELI